MFLFTPLGTASTQWQLSGSCEATSPGKVSEVEATTISGEFVGVEAGKFSENSWLFRCPRRQDDGCLDLKQLGFPKDLDNRWENPPFQPGKASQIGIEAAIEGVCLKMKCLPPHTLV